MVWEDKQTNLTMFEELLSNSDLGDIVVLPEMFTTGFTMDPGPFAQKMDGEPIEVSTMIYKGSTIDLEIGNGEGNTRFLMPNFLGRTLDEARFQIRASGLKNTDIYYILNQLRAHRFSGTNQFLRDGLI